MQARIIMTAEKQLLTRYASILDSGICLPLGADIERELAIFYMPPLSSDCTDEELLEWGIQYKKIVTQKLEMFRQGLVG